MDVNNLWNIVLLRYFNQISDHSYRVIIIHAFEKVSGVTIPYVMDERRPGDITVCYSDPIKAKHEFGWKV